MSKDNLLLDITKKAVREYPPKTKFTSIFGATDIVSDKDDFIIKNDEVLVHCNSGQYRMIYDGKYWAKIH